LFESETSKFDESGVVSWIGAKGKAEECDVWSAVDLLAVVVVR